MNVLKSLYSYNDYRKYLQDFYFFQKKNNTHYSFQTFSTKAGMKSPNLLKLVMEGQRNLSLESMTLFSKALGLCPEEKKFFVLLVLYNQASTAEDKKTYSSWIKEVKASKSSESFLHAKTTLQFISKWYAFLMMVALNGVKKEESFEKVGKKLKIDEEEFQKDLEFLLQEKILAETDGVLKQVSELVTYNDKNQLNQAQKLHLKNQVEKSAKVFDEKYGEKGKFYSGCFLVNQNDLPAYEEAIKAFYHRLSNLSAADEGAAVYQANLQFFHVIDR